MEFLFIHKMLKCKNMKSPDSFHLFLTRFIRFVDKIAVVSNIIRLLIQIFSQKIDRVVWNDVRNLQESFIQCWYYKLHEVISKWHLFYFFLTLILDKLNNLLGKILSSCLYLNSCLSVFSDFFFSLVERYLIFFLNKLLITFYKL